MISSFCCVEFPFLKHNGLSRGDQDSTPASCVLCYPNSACMILSDFIKILDFFVSKNL